MADSTNSNTLDPRQPANGRAKQQPEPRDPIVVAIIGVLGAAGVAWVAHGFAKRREAIARFAVAAREFHAAFADELAILESKDEIFNGIDRLLLEAYESKQRLAAAAFEHAIPKRDRANFKAAWKKYHSGAKIDGEPFSTMEYGETFKQSLFAEYKGAGMPGATIAPRSLAVRRIRELLKFAEHE